jgi:hypothetical protein
MTNGARKNIFAKQNIVPREVLRIAIHTAREIFPSGARAFASSRVDKHPLLSPSKKLLTTP